MLSKAVVKARPSVLWCYKKGTLRGVPPVNCALPTRPLVSTCTDLGFTTYKKKRMKIIKSKMAKGLLDPDKDDPFELFISSTDIRYCKPCLGVPCMTYGPQADPPSSAVPAQTSGSGCGPKSGTRRLTRHDN
jgi:hypothetical protein